VHSEVRVVAREALRVAVAQEGTVSAVAVESRKVVVASEGHDIAFEIRVCCSSEFQRRVNGTRSSHLKMVRNSRVLTSSSQSLVLGLYDLGGASSVRTPRNDN